METMMNTIDDVIETMKRIVAEEYPDYELDIREVVKHDGNKMGASLKRKGSNVAPTVYLQDDVSDVESYVREMIEVLMEHLPNQNLNLDMSFVRDFAQVRPLLFVSLYNTTKSAEFLESGVIHCATEFKDISMVPKIYVGNVNDGSGAITVNKGLLNIWAEEYDIDEQDVIAEAVTNAQTLRPFAEFPLPDELAQFVPFKVWTNKEQLDGSSVITYPNFRIKMENEYPDGYYLIPSSRHEVIVLPMMPGIDDHKKLTDMVRTVNATTITAADFLSDYAYIVKGSEVITIED